MAKSAVGGQRLAGIGVALGLGAALIGMVGCAGPTAASMTPLVRPMEGNTQAWSPADVALAEKAFGHQVLVPTAVVRRITGLPLTQVTVQVASPTSIYYVFGKYHRGDNTINPTGHDRWVVVTENRTTDFSAPNPPGVVKGTGIDASVQAHDTNITVECDRTTDNALRIAQLISEQ